MQNRQNTSNQTNQWSLVWGWTWNNISNRNRKQGERAPSAGATCWKRILRKDGTGSDWFQLNCIHWLLVISKGWSVWRSSYRLHWAAVAAAAPPAGCSGSHRTAMLWSGVVGGLVACLNCTGAGTSSSSVGLRLLETAIATIWLDVWKGPPPAANKI